MKNIKQPHHFFFSNALEWRTTTDEVSLFDLLDYFRKQKTADGSNRRFNLYYVPAPWDAEYLIDEYAPQIEGAILLHSIYSEI